MRSLRWLLLVAILALVGGVSGIYRTQRNLARASARPLPASIPIGMVGSAIDYEWGQSENGKPAVHVSAKNSRLLDNGLTELEGVEIRIYMKDGKHYDRIRSPQAQFATSEARLYAPGEAEITLNIPVEGEPLGALTSIKAAGINFDSRSGKAVTDKHVAFTFQGGDGVCDGGAYDPETHELQLLHNVMLNLHGKDPKSTPMKVEAGELKYSEKYAVINLGGWSRMTRGETIINAGPSIVKLKDKKLDTVDAPNAVGSDKRPGKELDYTAGQLHVQYNEDGEMEKLNGSAGAKLISHGNGSVTTMTGDTVDLLFNTETGESELASAIAKGNSAIESKPPPDPKGATGDTKLLKSDVLNLFMKPGGRDLDRVVTHTPGTLEFVPNQVARHRRILKSSEMDIRYGQKSEIQSFHAVAANTETHPSEEDRKKKKPNLAIAYTSSKVLDAVFDESAQLKSMKQTGDFKYVEGPRKAQSEVATLEQDRNVMNLENHARVSDDAGSTAGDQIELQQTTGDFDAKGHVSTTRLPDDKKTSSDMLDTEEPTQGMADRVTSASRNHLIHYIGNAVVWQSSNRIQADRIDIDRDTKSLIADGQVISQFQDKKKEDPAAKKKTDPGSPVFTIVKSQHMTYTDADRQAVYTGGTNFWRAGLTVKSTTLKSFLNDNKSDADSRIHHAIADGVVEIVQAARDRQRIGNSDHAEYYTDVGKIILTGGEPQLKDSLKGNTKGDKLTYFTEDDKLIVDGASQKPVQTELHKKKR
ncbi:MAG: lipopolysaccharide export system protein LptA [Bryobacterales bacterium]|nr:lipopolysaccharide export system protein LptA [Bryobacterales bacterium]